MGWTTYDLRKIKEKRQGPMFLWYSDSKIYQLRSPQRYRWPYSPACPAIRDQVLPLFQGGPRFRAYKWEPKKRRKNTFLLSIILLASMGIFIMVSSNTQLNDQTFFKIFCSWTIIVWSVLWRAVCRAGLGNSAFEQKDSVHDSWLFATYLSLSILKLISDSSGIFQSTKNLRKKVADDDTVDGRNPAPVDMYETL